jgi:PAS domain-containing protein
MVFQMGVPFQAFIDRLPAPIFVVDNDGVIRTANKPGLALLRKTPEQVDRMRWGTVFECAYARLPEGCGRTVHCSGCAIRRSVYHTFETGEPLVDVPATLRFAGAGEPQDIEMLLSTEKMGSVVVLRVENMVVPSAC